LPGIINTGELFTQHGYSYVVDGDRYIDLLYAPNISFAHAAAVSWIWMASNLNTRAPIVGDTLAPWPVPDVPPRFYDAYASEYRNAQDFHAFGAFFVSHLESNGSGCPPGLSITGGYSSTAGQNQVPAEERLRYTFIFAPDLQALAASCQYSERTLMYAVFTHELGHQRAGLTHVEEFPNYHNGTLPQGRVDIMHRVLSLDDITRYEFHFFDELPLPPFIIGDEESCNYNLYNWRSITN